MGCLRYFCSITKTVLATKRNVVPTSDGIRLLTCNSAYPVCLCQPIRVSMSSVEHSNCLQGQADVGSGAVFGTLPARKWQNIMALRAVLFMSSKIASKPNVGKEANKLDYHRRGSWIYVSLPHPYSRMLKDVAHSFIVSISTYFTSRFIYVSLASLKWASINQLQHPQQVVWQEWAQGANSLKPSWALRQHGAKASTAIFVAQWRRVISKQQRSWKVLPN